MSNKYKLSDLLFWCMLSAIFSAGIMLSWHNSVINEYNNALECRIKNCASDADVHGEL